MEELGTKETNRALRKSKGKVRLINPNSTHFLVAGLRKNLEVEIEGSAGYYLGTCIDGPKIHVTGNAGWYAGDNITKGEILIEGGAGDGVGQGLYGGTVTVKNNCGSRTGQLMKNGTVIVGGDSGFMTGLYAFGGRIIVCGDVGLSAGESIIGGEIYVGGKIQSLGKNAKKQKVSKEEQDQIIKILKQNEVKPPSKFTKIVPSEKRFYRLDIGWG